MSLFPLPQVAPSQAGLFDNLRNALSNPAVKAGLLQAGMSMLNPNPNSSPFAQVFTGVNQGIQAHQRYQDLETQRQIEKQSLLAEQAREDRKFGLQTALNNARMKQIENSIATSQANSQSLGNLRAAQTERARRGPLGARGSTPEARWEKFYREKLRNSALDPNAELPANERAAIWRQEFDALEAAGRGLPGGGAAPPDFSQLAPEDIQQLADENGISFEEAQQLLLGVQP